MKYSIVIPTYNNVNYAQVCLSSIVTNSNKEDIEVIVIDNGCTDSTPAMLAAFKNVPDLDVTVITNTKNEGFCVATNQGMAQAKGEYIVWLNDDTIVPKNWLPKMRRWFDVKHKYTSKIGAVGAMSNYVKGDQLVTFDEKATDTNLEQYNRTVEDECQRIEGILATSPIDDYKLQGTLSGFCLMIKREVYEKIGGIDERFSPGGYCDDDYSVRIVEAGYSLLCALDVFVYHYGSVTLNSEYPELQGGCANWDIFVKKYFTPDATKKLILATNLRLDTHQDLNIYKKMCEKNFEIADGVIIVDDKSKLFNEKAAKDIWGDKLVSYVRLPKSFDSDYETARKKITIEEAAKFKEYEWCILLDHDECFHKSTTRRDFDKLMNPMSPYHMAYNFKFNYYWKSDKFIRCDRTYKNPTFTRMWKNGLFDVTLSNGVHCGNRPMSIPLYNIAHSKVAIDHYGYCTEELVNEKLERYSKIDKTNGTAQLKNMVGAETYAEAFDDFEAEYCSYTPYTLAVNCLYKDEFIDMGQWLMNFYPLVDEWVMGFTGDSEDQKKLFKELGVKVIDLEFNNDFASLRNSLIDHSSSKYCMHIDPDESPADEVKGELTRLLPKDADAIMWELRTIHNSGDFYPTRQPRIFKNIKQFRFNGRVHETLGPAMQEVSEACHLKVIPAEASELMSVNKGFLVPKEAIRKKLEFYAKLLHLEIESNPKNDKAHLELGVHYRNTEDYDKATELFKKCLEINPKYTSALRELAFIKIKQAYDIIKLAEGHTVDDASLKNTLMEMEKSLRPFVLSDRKVG